MNCPKGCQTSKWQGYGSARHRYNAPASLRSLDFSSLSKSGKTLYLFFQCPKCHRIYRQGHRVHVLGSKEGEE